jgi:hypothetical protein
MRLRHLLVAAAVIATTAVVPAEASSPRISMDGPWGAVTIRQERLFLLADQAATLTEDRLEAFLASMTREEQIALEYAINPALLTRYASDGEDDLGPCGATVEECDPPEPQPKPEADVRQPDPDPVWTCGHEEFTQTWNNVVLRKPAMHFRTLFYRCYDGVLVSDVSVSSHYEITGWGIWWSCQYDEFTPRNEMVPPADAPAVHVSSIGHCTYRPRAKIGSFGFDVPLRDIFPGNHASMDAAGGLYAVR